MKAEMKKANSLINEIFTTIFPIDDYELCCSLALLCADENMISSIKTREMYEENGMINSDISEQPELFWIEVKRLISDRLYIYMVNYDN